MVLYLERDVDVVVVVELCKYNFLSTQIPKNLKGIQCTVLREVAASNFSKPQLRLKLPGWTAIQGKVKIVGVFSFQGKLSNSIWKFK